VRLRSPQADRTRRIGHRLGTLLKAGDVVCLYGDLGAGKTVFVKGVASAFGLDERDVASASFTIIAEYEATTPPLYHIDLYRLEGGADLGEIGVSEYLGGDGVALVEWADRLSPEDTRDAIRVTITIEDELAVQDGEPARMIEILGAAKGIDEANWDNL
jgi:tRNA threonylcarbamoyladenosine biosynthesis protein TsaE